MTIDQAPVARQLPQPATWTPAEAAAYLAVPEGTVRAMCRKTGEVFGVPVLRHGTGLNTRYRIPRARLERLVEGDES